MFTLTQCQKSISLALSVVICTLAFSSSVNAQSADELAKKLANPISSLISLPFQANFDFGGGIDDDGFRFTLNTQPVIPVSISDDWNMISRTIVPIIYQDDYINDGGFSQFGLGDTVQSLFFSPKAPGPGGLIWGIGPVFLLPTASNDSLGAEKWGAGPTGVFLYQENEWTYGALFNHVVDFAGDDNRADINSTFIQPFLSYAPGKGRSYTINTEATFDHETDQWTLPINIQASQVLRLGNQLVSIAGGVKYYADGPESAPDWGVRLAFTLLFPK